MVADNAGEQTAEPGLLGKVLRIWQVSLYLGLYLVLVALYIVSTSGNTRIMPVSEWQAAYLDNSPSAIGIRVQVPYEFAVPGGPQVSLEPGQRVSPGVAAQLSAAIRAGKFAEKELTLYRPGWFWNIDWARYFTLYNLLGMFGALFLGLRKPVAQMLDATGSKTAAALSDARAAHEEALTLKARYEQMLAELEKEKAQLAQTLAEEEELEHNRIMQAARHEAAGIVESVKQSVDAEVQTVARRLRAEVARQALDLARQRLTAETTATEHKKLFTDFIGDLERMVK